MTTLNFVHVPKTGGRHLTTTVLPYLTLALREQGFDPKNCLKYIHTGWPVLREEDGVVLTYRYPPRHSVSAFFYFRPWLVDGNPENGRSNLLSALSGAEGQRIFNFQTKFICSTEDPDITGLQRDIVYDLDLLPPRLEATTMFVDGDDLQVKKISNVYLESCRFFALEPESETSIPVIYTPEFALEYSKLVYDILTEEELLWLEDRNELDMELYRQISGH